MKKLIIIMLVLISSILYAQTTYNSPSTVIEDITYKSEMRNRKIFISDKEISISHFVGNEDTPMAETQYFVVDSIVDKDWGWPDNICKTYYCITKDSDFINSYQKAIIYIGHRNMLKMGLFATEIMVFMYQFKLE
ncbi:MAG: hypothetical protein ACOH2V_00650 [Candidatus Saccharimonadaceae bacterium]